MRYAWDMYEEYFIGKRNRMIGAGPEGKRLSAMASGKPVIAYGRGGALETIVSYNQQVKMEQLAPTGLFFYEQNVDSLIDAVELFCKFEKKFDPGAIRNHARQWDREILKNKIKENIFEKLKL